MKEKHPHFGTTQEKRNVHKFVFEITSVKIDETLVAATLSALYHCLIIQKIKFSMIQWDLYIHVCYCLFVCVIWNSDLLCQCGKYAFGFCNKSHWRKAQSIKVKRENERVKQVLRSKQIKVFSVSSIHRHKG